MKMPSNCFIVLALLGAACLSAAVPTRVRRADLSDNSIDVDAAAGGDNTSASAVDTSESTTPADTLEASQTPDTSADTLEASKASENPADTAEASESSESTTGAAFESRTDFNPALTLPPTTKLPFDDEDSDFEDTMKSSSSNNQGSNVFSLLNLVGQLFPGSAGSNVRVKRLFERFFFQNQQAITSVESYITHNLLPPRRSQDVGDNEIEIDELPSASRESSESSEEESGEETEESKSNENTREEIDSNGAENVDNANAKQSEENDSSNSEDDDEPPGGGDGGGGGVLGILAGLSGDDGQSDLGSLLAGVSGIVVQLSGDGIDVNGLIASGLGLFVGLLSEGMENPGSVLAGYINTALEALTGGGSTNNGAFFGNFLSTLLKGISAAPEQSSEEAGGGGSDSAGFFLSLIMGLSGSSSGKGHPMEQ